MIKRNNLKLTAMMLLIGSGLFTGCNVQKTTQNTEHMTTNNTVVESTPSDLIDADTQLQVSYAEDDMFTEWEEGAYTTIALGHSTTIEGTGALVEDSVIRITRGGTYVLSGTLADGQIIVDTEAKETVRLVLNSMSIHSEENAPVYIKNAEKVVISLQEGTENTISDTVNYAFAEGEDEPDAALFSKADLTINGTGSLTVEAAYGDAITSKDSLKVMEGTLHITSADDGLRGKDMVAIKAGHITITSNGDAIKSTNATDSGRGFILVENGTFNINAEGDGFQAETDLQILDGTFNMTTGGGSSNGTVHVPSSKNDNKTFDATAAEQAKAIPTTPSEVPEATTDVLTTATEEDTISTKGIKATSSILIEGGTFTIDSADDAIHSNSTVMINAGDFKILTGDDAIHGNVYVELNGGQINIEKCYEGIEGTEIIINNGSIYIVSDDDGVNASDGGSTMTVPGATDSTVNLTVNGGEIFISAGGDGLDSNGAMILNGGTSVVNALIGKGENALDYDGSFQVNGGVFATTGGTSLSLNNSTQNVVSMSFNSYQEAGTVVAVLDENNQVIIAFAPDRSSNSVFLSSSALEAGKTYTLVYGGSISEAGLNGLYTSGTYSGGTAVTEFTIENLMTYIDETGVTSTPPVSSNGGGGGKGGMGRGQMAEVPADVPVS